MTVSSPHWSVGHESHSGGIGGFSDLIAARLAKSGGRDTETYDLLPNCVFDHMGLVITSPSTVGQGRLEVRRRRSPDVTRYDIRRYDRTSGVTLEASFARTSAPGPVTVSSRRSVGHARTAAQQGFDRSVIVECAADTVVEYELFELLPDLLDRGEPFRLHRLDGAADVIATVLKVEETVVQLDDTPERVAVVALLAAADVPSYWWVDARRRVLLAATTLWTFVMTEGGDR
jgi:hypothetical protein